MNKNKKIGVIGSRALPDQYQNKVNEVIKYLINQGHTINHGGAMGTDHFVLKSLLENNACDKSILFSAWQTIESFPNSVKPDIQKFVDAGGCLFCGAGAKQANPAMVRASLLARNCELVKNSDGLVAFIHGESRGTWFTIREAVKKKIPVVIFLVDNKSPSLPAVFGLNWKKLVTNDIWSGALKGVAYAK